MSYVSDPAGLGIGKRYGPLHLGSVGGVTINANGEYMFVAEVTAEELAAVASISYTIPNSYAKIKEVYVEVEEAFGAGDTVDVLYDGSTVLDAPVAVSAVGLLKGVTTVIGETTVEADTAVTIDASLIDSGSATGSIKVVVKLLRI